MDSMLRDGLCVVGVLYLLLHLCRSIGSLRRINMRSATQ